MPIIVDIISKWYYNYGIYILNDPIELILVSHSKPLQPKPTYTNCRYLALHSTYQCIVDVVSK